MREHILTLQLDYSLLDSSRWPVSLSPSIRLRITGPPSLGSLPSAPHLPASHLHFTTAKPLPWGLWGLKQNLLL